MDMDGEANRPAHHASDVATTTTLSLSALPSKGVVQTASTMTGEPLMPENVILKNARSINDTSKHFRDLFH